MSSEGIRVVWGGHDCRLKRQLHQLVENYRYPVEEYGFNLLIITFGFFVCLFV